MKTSIDNLKSIGSMLLPLISIIGFLVTIFLQNTISLSDVIEVIGISITITSIILVIIEKYLWKNLLLFFSKYPLIWQLMEKYEVPILKENYNCVIKYKWKDSLQEKKVNIEVSQTYTTINITLISDEVRSHSTISEITKQDNAFVLYYIYKTDPKVEFHENNPIQLGGCKIILEPIIKSKSNDKLKGIYWTTSKTKGDMYLD